MSAMATEQPLPFPIPPSPPAARPRSAPFTIPPPSPSRAARTVVTRGSLVDVRSRISDWTGSIPLPLLFVAGAAVGVLLASLIVLFTHSTKSAKAPTDALVKTAMVAPVVTEAKWQPNVIVIHPAAPDPMFDAPPVVEPAALHAPAARLTAPAAKKAVTRNAVRRAAAGKPAATGDLLTAAL